jgi:carboxyl-terminal processing protease
MRSRFSTALVVIIFTLLGFNAGYLLGQSPWAPFQAFNTFAMADDRDATASFWEAYNLVQERYFDQPVDTDQLVDGAIEGMLATLDDAHTRYLAPEAEAAARARMSGEYQGIGAEVESLDGNITVVSPIDGSPAAAAGLQPGDILREADGVELTGMAVGEAAGVVRGPAGTSVTLLIERDGEQFEVEIERDVIPLRSVNGRMLEENIAYIRLSRFGEQSNQELVDKIEELEAEDAAGLILDLRRNPGGGLTSALDIADQFLDEGVILVERFGSGRDEIFRSSDDGVAEEIPLVVLIDEGSASASEVLAGAIRDRERGVLIGETTFGKGTVQTWQPLSNGGGVRLTIARWLTPDENWVHESGLEPDYRVPLPDDFTGDPEEDDQLQAAIDYLLGETVTTAPPEFDADENEQ